MRRPTRALLASMIMAIPFATAACEIPAGPCTITVFEGPLSLACTFT